MGLPLAEDQDGSFTELALGNDQPVPMIGGNVGAPKHGLYAEFYMHPLQDKAESTKEGRPIYKDVPYIMIMVPGDKGSVIRRPVRTGNDPANDNNRFYNEYVAFVQNRTQPLEGTPLAQWNQITKGESLELEYFNIRTVEQLADLNDTSAQNVMGFSTLKTKAKAYLDMTKEEAPLVKLQEELAVRDNEIDTLKNAMEEMRVELQDMKKGK